MACTGSCWGIPPLIENVAGRGVTWPRIRTKRGTSAFSSFLPSSHPPMGPRGSFDSTQISLPRLVFWLPLPLFDPHSPPPWFSDFSCLLRRRVMAFPWAFFPAFFLWFVRVVFIPACAVPCIALRLGRLNENCVVAFARMYMYSGVLSRVPLGRSRGLGYGAFYARGSTVGNEGNVFLSRHGDEGRCQSRSASVIENWDVSSCPVGDDAQRKRIDDEHSFGDVKKEKINWTDGSPTSSVHYRL